MITFDKCKSFKGKINVPSDKSITHRAVIMGAMADGVTVVRNPLLSRDTIATMNAVQQLGVNIVNERSRLLIHSEGVKIFKEPYDVINCDNSGTTARLMMGVLSPRHFYSVLTGDPSLLRRPMARVIKPLSILGADIRSKDSNKYLPATVLPADMKAGEIIAEVKSAQVKSSVLLAGVQL
ncbi:MAG: 3-phosphoshikimate 1-carboxyvinyltransferase, partial [Candidatus Mucispirillum faecigallinarum]|nr:3-phosphoshikimate 1-carboxyvinyltransferase [Candidatus Mucispirillum faecigallinarum]